MFHNVQKLINKFIDITIILPNSELKRSTEKKQIRTLIFFAPSTDMDIQHPQVATLCKLARDGQISAIL